MTRFWLCFTGKHQWMRLCSPSRELFVCERCATTYTAKKGTMLINGYPPRVIPQLVWILLASIAGGFITAKLITRSI